MPGLLGAMFALSGIVLILAQYTFIPATTAFLATLLIGFGGYQGEPDPVRFGFGLLLATLALAAVFGLPTSPTLAVGVLGVLAYDLLDNARSLGRQLGRSADTWRPELVHGGATLIGGTIVAGVIFGVYSAAPTGWPLAGLIFALIAGWLLTLAMEM